MKRSTKTSSGKKIAGFVQSLMDYLIKNLGIFATIIGLVFHSISRKWKMVLFLFLVYLLLYGLIKEKLPKYKKITSFILVVIVIISIVGGLYIDHNKSLGCVRILNKQYKEQVEFGPLIRAFEKESGISVTIESPNPEKYSDILIDRYGGKGDHPTLFMISGHYDLEKYKVECLDLTKTPVVKELTSDDFALKGSDGHIYGIGFIVESFGITVNTTLLEDAGYKLSDIHSFSDLKHIVQDITSRKEELGFAAFTTGTVGQDSGYYRLAQHAPAVPLFYEIQDCGFDFERHLEGTYMDAFQDYVDLCLDNATTSRKEAIDCSLKDAQQEFEEGKAVFHQDGSWSYKKLKQGMLKYGSGEIAVIPMYMGIRREDKQALNETCSYYWCVDRYASEDDIKASLQFLKWMVTSKEATQIVANQMGLQMPYKKAMTPDNIYLETLQTQIENGYIPVMQYYNYGNRTSWVNALFNAIKSYASGTGEWAEVKEAFTTLW